MLRRIALTLTMTVFALSPALAQTAPTGSTATTGTSSGAFNALSPGNQKIAQSLYQAQSAPGDSATGSSSALTLDQIAAMKSGQGWGNVFRQMKADGRVGAKNLGEVMSGHYSPPATTSSPGSTAGGATAATSGSGGATAPTSSGGTTATTNGASATTATTKGSNGKSGYKSTGGDVSTGTGGTVTGTNGSAGKSSGSGHQAGKSGSKAGSGKASSVVSTAKGSPAGTSTGVTTAGPSGNSGHGSSGAGKSGHGKK